MRRWPSPPRRLIFGSIHLQVGLGLANVTLVLALATVGARLRDRGRPDRPPRAEHLGHACFNLVAVVAAYATTLQR